MEGYEMGTFAQRFLAKWSEVSEIFNDVDRKIQNIDFENLEEPSIHMDEGICIVSGMVGDSLDAVDDLLLDLLNRMPTETDESKENAA